MKKRLQDAETVLRRAEWELKSFQRYSFQLSRRIFDTMEWMLEELKKNNGPEKDSTGKSDG